MENRIHIPAVFIPTTYLSVNLPNFAHFGTIGEVIGHEITHGFDKTGSQFDEEGRIMCNRLNYDIVPRCTFL